MTELRQSLFESAFKSWYWTSKYCHSNRGLCNFDETQTLNHGMIPVRESELIQDDFFDELYGIDLVITN